MSCQKAEVELSAVTSARKRSPWRWVAWLLTVTVGLPVVVLSVSGPAVPVESVQLWLGVESPKTRLPTVRAPSRVMAALEVRSRTAKSAVELMPETAVLLDQLAVVGQEPPAALTQTEEPVELQKRPTVPSPE